jgi:hypothetical protein
MPSSRSPALGLGSLDLRAGAFGLLAISLALITIAVLGPAGITAAVAGLIVFMIHPTDGREARLSQILVVTLVGTALTAVGVWAGTEGWVAALVMTLVTFSATLTAAYGRSWGTVGYLLNLWVLLALVLTASEHSVALMSGAFLIGGTVAGGIELLRHRRPGPAGSAHAAEEAEAPGEMRAASGRSRLGPLRNALSADSPLFRFGLVRGLAAGSTTLIGWYLFDTHPYWAVLTAFVVIQTEPRESVRRGIQRTVGTAFGVLVGIALAQVFHGTWSVAAVFMIAAFLMVAVRDVS